MNKRILLLLAIAGSTLFWAALITEISFRYIDVASAKDSLSIQLVADDESDEPQPSATRESFFVLFVLVAFAVMSTSFLTYQITKRNLLTQEGHNKESTRRQNKRQVQGNKTSFKTTRDRNFQKKTNNLPKTKQTTSTGHSQRANTGASSDAKPNASQTMEASGKRVKGRVRVYYTRRSYGFVEDESKQTIFFHKSAVAPDINERDLTKKPNVSYVVTPSDRGPVATDIQLEQ